MKNTVIIAGIVGIVAGVFGISSSVVVLISGKKPKTYWGN